MKFRFDDGAEVLLREDRPALDLKAGACGRVWARYEREPPAYEVTFRGADGHDFDALMDEDELDAADDNARRRGVGAAGVRGRRAC